MRIEAYNQVQQLYQTKRPSRIKGSMGVTGTDTVQISSMGKDFQTAKTAVKAAPDVREDVTAPIRASINSSTYEVSSESFAEKLLKKYEETR